MTQGRRGYITGGVWWLPAAAGGLAADLPGGARAVVERRADGVVWSVGRVAGWSTGEGMLDVCARLARDAKAAARRRDPRCPARP